MRLLMGESWAVGEYMTRGVEDASMRELVIGPADNIGDAALGL